MARIAHPTIRILLAVALFASTGGHWALLQTVAWSSMMLRYSRGSDFVTAAEKTFDGRHPCPLCKKIARAQKGRGKQESQSPAGKLEFCLSPDRGGLYPPSDFWRMPLQDLPVSGFAWQPPGPPPRRLPG